MRVKFTKHAMQRARERNLQRFLAIKKIKLAKVKPFGMGKKDYYDKEHCRYVLSVKKDRAIVVTMFNMQRKEGANEVQTQAD